ncbi:MAG TPA: ABC transporter substrate-binding protein [Candidatus Paceibacterota bacterium]
MQPIKGSRVLMFVGALVIVVATALLFTKIFQAIPPSVPLPSKVLSEPKTIGIISFRQQAKAVEGLKEGLKELGYSNITYKEFIILPSDNMMKEVAANTKTLLGEKVDLIYAGLEFQALPVITTTKEMGNNTPIIFSSAFHDPVAYGLAKSFLSSGNNATGVALNIVEVIQKQLEFLKKIKPDAQKIGVFTDGFMVPPLSDEFYPELRRQAAKFGYEVVEYTTDAPPPQAEAAWHTVAATIKPGDIDVLYHLAGHYFDSQEKSGAQEFAESELASRLKIVMVAPLEDLANGGTFGYSGDYTGAGKQSARMADKIFRGIKPSDIPLEYIKHVSLVVYPTRARQAGVEFPEFILSIADKIITEQ